MRVIPTPLEGVVVVEPDVRADARGAFFEAWHAPRYAEAGLAGRFIQCNMSRSARGVLRGLHLQHPKGQAKLVTVVEGAVFDVAVDVRRGSPTFARWFGVELTAASGRQLYVPEGFAHGFLALAESVLVYLATEVYAPEAELVIRWDDPEIAVAWPAAPAGLSPRDGSAPLLGDVLDRLPTFDS